MRFSLKAIFGVFTIACLCALLVQQTMKNEELEKREVSLAKLINEFDPNLEEGLPFLRIAVEPDKELEAIYKQVFNSNEAANERFGDEALNTPSQISVAHLPCLDSAIKKFLIYIPEDNSVRLKINVSSDLFPSDRDSIKSDSPFQLDHNVDLQLPTGKSVLVLEPTKGNPELWGFVLNEEVICQADSTNSGLSGRNMIWLLSTLKFLGSFRHHNVRRQGRYVWADEKTELEFASFVSKDYVEAVVAKKTPEVSKLNCTLVIDKGAED